ncbi:hypothetical protein [Mycetocola zhadangensis]|uniref:Uncharacterized protein n=1 Tax=Mycetocola zhadangensis TaxID=1164595 RepID=A0A3L7J5D6_9MICO|nr:hypothetical protein [Mycetocola zhadangensis]RLQ85813.1 hypothetical protein D9V28_02855 [Mycetocola zhadangensis]GGE86064.1 hypothetical protein GCM10011313_05610 [Mycetocola zhadangensis]
MSKLSPPGSSTEQDPRNSFVTEESVYGTLLVSGMIVVSGTYGASSWATFLSVLGTVIVFWVAHVYAGTVAGHAVMEGKDIALGTAFKRSLRRSVGFLTSALIPCVLLLIGALRVIPDALAIWLALWVGVVILGALGYRAFALRGSAWTVRILGSLGTATLGIAMILLKALIH